MPWRENLESLVIFFFSVAKDKEKKVKQRGIEIEQLDILGYRFFF
jgi:hypothetical protein